MACYSKKIINGASINKISNDNKYNIKNNNNVKRSKYKYILNNYNIKLLYKIYKNFKNILL